MPSPVYDLTPQQLEWLYSNQSLAGGEPLGGEDGNHSQAQQQLPQLQHQPTSPTTAATQILFTADDTKLKSVPEVVDDDDQDIRDTIDNEGMVTMSSRKGSPQEDVLMMAGLGRRDESNVVDSSSDNRHPRPSTAQKQLFKTNSAPFPHTNERLTWDQSFENLKVYHAEYGHCNVPREYPPMPQLGGWVHRQRLKKKSPSKYGGLTDFQIEQLDALGFSWFIRCMNGTSRPKKQYQ